MTRDRDPIEELLLRYVEQHVVHGRKPSPESLCGDDPWRIEALRECIRVYERLDETLALPASDGGGEPEAGRELPAFEGFRTIERLGGGGGGEVYKLEDLALRRIVAGKVIRPDDPLRTGLDGFLREARALALFEDPRIVRLLEFRGQAAPPLLVMEYVDGFELDRIAGSLEFAQRARVMVEIAEAVHHAHALGIQHRDLKPANILLDARLVPRILDFGLSRSEPHRGHGVGTLPYMAPEQLDSDRPIDAKSDVYALGVILYEMLSGARPYAGATDRELAAAASRGNPRLPVEVEPAVPEPLQAIALKAMERDPDERYASAREMAQELRRFLEGKPVLARPSLYRSELAHRVRAHLEQVREWQRIQLVYPHETERIRDAYGRLEAREDDWIVRGRSLSFSQISLYLGAFLLVAGSLLYFYAHFLEAVAGLLRPLLVLGVPFAGLSLAAQRLHRGDRRPVAVAFHLGAVLLLPMLLLILLEEAGLWPAGPGDERELFGEGLTSNRQLQVASAAACLWSCWLALRTRTLTLSSGFTALLTVFGLAVLADFGLRSWLEVGRFDLLALHLVPLLAACAAAGGLAERRELPFLALPLEFTAVGLFVIVLELLALDGRAFAYLGLSMAPFQGAGVSHPLLLDTLTAMTVNGILFYAAGWLLERYGTALWRSTAWLLYVISPFAILQPVAYLDAVGEYSRRYDWLYLALALVITFLSHYRQRRSFYYAGLLNTGGALWYITLHSEWFDRPAWAVAVVVAGVATLAGGFALHVRERNRRRSL